MNLLEIEESIIKAKSLLEKLNNNRKEEIINIISNFKPGDKFESNGSGNVIQFEIVRITEKRIIYNAIIGRNNTQKVSRRSSYNAFITELFEFTIFGKKFEREYKLKKLGC